MRPRCALHAPSMLPLCALHAPTMCPLCPLYVPSMGPLCALYAQSGRKVGASKAHSGPIEGAQRAHRGRIEGSFYNALSFAQKPAHWGGPCWGRPLRASPHAHSTPPPPPRPRARHCFRGSPGRPTTPRNWQASVSLWTKGAEQHCSLAPCPKEGMTAQLPPSPAGRPRNYKSKVLEGEGSGEFCGHFMCIALVHRLITDQEGEVMPEVSHMGCPSAALRARGHRHCRPLNCLMRGLRGLGSPILFFKVAVAGCQCPLVSSVQTTGPF